MKLSYLIALAMAAPLSACSSEPNTSSRSESQTKDDEDAPEDDEDDDNKEDEDSKEDEDKEDEDKEDDKKDAGSRPTGRDSGSRDARADASMPRTDASTPRPRSDASAAVDSGGGAPPTPLPMGDNCLQGTGDFNDNGPYRVARKDVTIGAQGPYTIFYPNPLEADCPHPIVAWGNGTAVTGADIYGFYQEHAASWGIVVVASHNSNVGSGEFHKAGLDYMLAQNEDSSSEFFGKLSPRAGTSGHSQGGMGANVGASHPNVQAIGNVQGAVAFGGAPPGKAFLCLTGTEDIAIEGCKASVNGTTSPALYANWQGGTHTGTATLGGFIGGDPGTRQYMRLYTGWFRCFLADDQQACAMFKGGADCPVCKDSGWAEIFANNF